MCIAEKSNVCSSGSVFNLKPAMFVQQGDPKPTKPLNNETNSTLASTMISCLPPYLHLAPVVSMATTLGLACQWSFLTPEGNLWPKGSWPGSRGQEWPEGDKSTSVIGSLTSPRIFILRFKHRPRPSVNQLKDCTFSISNKYTYILP